MNILAVTANQLFPHSPTGSQGIFFANFLRNLQPHVGRIVVVAPRAYVPGVLFRLPRFARYRVAARQHYFGIDVYRPAFLSMVALRHLWFQARSMAFSALPLCRRLHERWRFDLVVGHCLDSTSQLAVCAARELGLRCANWAIGGDVNTSPGRSKENAALLRHVVRHSDLVLTFSDALRRTILRHCPGARNVHAFYWGTDLRDVPGPDLDRRRTRLHLALDPERKYMISVGQATATKGTGEFYEAFRRLAACMDDLSAVWVGSGPDAPMMLDRARRDGLADRFLLTGQVPRARALQYMHAADVMAFATHTEGMPNVVVEAMACGLPVVATPVGGIPELIAEGRTGRLAPARDAASLAAAVEEVLREPDPAREMGLRGREFVLRYFDGRANAPLARDIFRNVAAGGRADVDFPLCANVPPGVLPIEIRQ